MASGSSSTSIPKKINAKEGNFVKVATLEGLQRENRLHLKVGGRQISILRYKEEIYCMDSICYHTGGPLTLGDIEELVPGEPCIKCPWHSHPISLKTGKKYSKGVEFDSNGKVKRVKAWAPGKRVAQRCFQTRIDSEGNIFADITLSDEQKVGSDRYATDERAASCFSKALEQKKK
mmetsp:Transcript_12772/g.17743  ORF Transcript_12772/g.17743 Transcript_12772/m.17743 type:complete len:176 (+) Transcript_12772:93-620(+)|eukprot:CAMPEP_0185262900 /NCGR_PEP_ID=MMETSP1359-20130426/10924_1 /TAXON_ID=552665 /ORGANISM="Bigelowiella longifila, Strain CCMP242" /LENGTH=175 /DNA_ID=CAMNT_0027849967 /DNA_START=12 /DNA_END=539 /DNA_ORIENTATION=-